ncbi:MAG: sigma-70 family RNA polymerase sigma factor [Muribaculaceae bacterium]|nr:sigma-70 family RNA polymerase sigma factor [Muribaculaceae bacterium]
MTDRNCIERLFREHYSAMYRLAAILLKDDTSARDVVHDVFATLLRSETEEEIGAGYLMRAVRNRCLNLLRDMPLTTSVERLINVDMIAADEEDVLNHEESLIKLSKIIREELPPQCSKVMLLRYKEGLQYQEIADRLSISKVAVYKHLKNGLDIIRRKLTE